MFPDYETARVMVALPRYQDALPCGVRALRACEWQFWPQLGIRRTVAWALRMSDHSADADAQVEAMRRMFIPPPFEILRARMITEAVGFPSDDGEVY